MDRDASRTLFRDNDVVTVYPAGSMPSVTSAMPRSAFSMRSRRRPFRKLLRIVKKLANANVTNMFITADHGFIYQNQPLDESDFISQEPSGTQITAMNRRYVLGRGLLGNLRLQAFHRSPDGA